MRKVSRGKGPEIRDTEHTNAIAGILGKGKSCKGD